MYAAAGVGACAAGDDAAPDTFIADALGVAVTHGKDGVLFYPKYVAVPLHFMISVAVNIMTVEVKRDMHGSAHRQLCVLDPIGAERDDDLLRVVRGLDRL